MRKRFPVDGGVDVSRRNLLRLAATLPALGAVPALAQTAWPERTLRLVVGYPPGQSADIVARVYAVVLSRELGQTVVVDNRAGANGAIGAQEVKNSRPDGYTLLFGAGAQMAINPALYPNLPYNTLRDFAPVSLAVTTIMFLLASPSLPVDNLQQLVALARKQPDKIDYGSGGIGITGHLGMELLQASAGIKLNHIPYKGGPPALNDLVAGRVSLMMDAAPAAVPHVKAGRVKALGIASPQRSPMFPDIPTLAEQGLPDFEVTTWAGLLAPARTPDAVIQRLNKAMRRAAADQQVRDILNAGASGAASNSPQEFEALIKADMQKWSRAVTLGGVKVE